MSTEPAPRMSALLHECMEAAFEHGFQTSLVAGETSLSAARQYREHMQVEFGKQLDELQGKYAELQAHYRTLHELVGTWDRASFVSPNGMLPGDIPIRVMFTMPGPYAVERQAGKHAVEEKLHQTYKGLPKP